MQIPNIVKIIKKAFRAWRVRRAIPAHAEIRRLGKEIERLKTIEDAAREWIESENAVRNSNCPCCELEESYHRECEALKHRRALAELALVAACSSITVAQ